MILRVVISSANISLLGHVDCRATLTHSKRRCPPMGELHLISNLHIANWIFSASKNLERETCCGLCSFFAVQTVDAEYIHISYWHRDRIIDRIIAYIILTWKKKKKDTVKPKILRSLTHLVRIQISWKADYCVLVKFWNHSIKKVLTKGSDFLC